MQFNMKQVVLGKIWHHTSEIPSTVILENPPVEVHAQDVNSYLTKIGIDAMATVNENSVLVRLNDPSGSNTIYTVYNINTTTNNNQC